MAYTAPVTLDCSQLILFPSLPNHFLFICQQHSITPRLVVERMPSLHRGMLFVPLSVIYLNYSHLPIEFSPQFSTLIYFYIVFFSSPRRPSLPPLFYNLSPFLLLLVFEYFIFYLPLFMMPFYFPFLNKGIRPCFACYFGNYAKLLLAGKMSRKFVAFRVFHELFRPEANVSGSYFFSNNSPHELRISI